MNALGEILQMPELPMVDSIYFIRQDFVHKHQGLPIKETVVVSLGDDKFKVRLAQE